MPRAFHHIQAASEFERPAIQAALDSDGRLRRPAAGECTPRRRRQSPAPSGLYYPPLTPSDSPRARAPTPAARNSQRSRQSACPETAGRPQRRSATPSGHGPGGGRRPSRRHPAEPRDRRSGGTSLLFRIPPTSDVDSTAGVDTVFIWRVREKNHELCRSRSKPAFWAVAGRFRASRRGLGGIRVVQSAQPLLHSHFSGRIGCLKRKR